MPNPTCRQHANALLYGSSTLHLAYAQQLLDGARWQSTENSLLFSLPAEGHGMTQHQGRVLVSFQIWRLKLQICLYINECPLPSVQLHHLSSASVVQTLNRDRYSLEKLAGHCKTRRSGPGMCTGLHLLCSPPGCPQCCNASHSLSRPV